MKHYLFLLIAILLPGCSKDGDTVIINQDVVPADPVAKEWRIPEMLATDNAGSAIPGQVRFDGAGNAIAIYFGDGVQARRYSRTRGWETEELVSDGTSIISNAQLAVDAAGNALVLYEQLIDPSGPIAYDIWWNRYTAGAGWGTPEILDADADSVTDPRVAFDGAGNAVAVWTTYDGAQTDTYAYRYVAGTGWTDLTPLEDGPEFSAGARVGVDSTGNALVVWRQDDGSGVFDVVSSRYVAGTGWTAVVPLESSAEVTSDLDLAVNAAGDAIAVWTQFDGLLLINLWANAFRPASGWGTATLVESDDTGSVSAPRVGIDGTGAGTAVWDWNTGSANHVYSGRYTPVSGWGSVARLGTLINGTGPQVAVNASGTTVATWIHTNGLVGDIVYSIREGDGAWAPVGFVEFDPYTAQAPSLAIDAEGNALALWIYYDPVATGFRTWANRYD